MSASHHPRVIVDHTHCGRHVTGLERITLELFSTQALAPLDVTLVQAGSRKAMMLRQTFGLPLSTLRDRSAVILCPGFPPSPLLTLLGGDRVVPYIHDLFLLTRPQDLNRRAKLYMVAPFRLATELRRFCRADAEIVLYRPEVRNVFEMTPADRENRPERPGELRLVAVGTVEPRKNLMAAAAIVSALRAGSHPAATLDIVGRRGWGVDVEQLAAMPGVTVHGYQPGTRVRALIQEADALMSTAHDEGLGLPLLEAQYAGLPVIAPDRPVFREVLGDSGVVLADLEPKRAAVQIGAALSTPGWRVQHLRSALHNLHRWNAAASADRLAVIARLITLSSELK